MNFLNEGEKNAGAHLRGTSERSSITDSSQSQSKKQLLINAFNNVNYGLSMRMGCCLALVVLLTVFMLVLIVQSITGVIQMKVLAIEENFVLNITQIYEYRLSMA